MFKNFYMLKQGVKTSYLVFQLKIKKIVIKELLDNFKLSKKR